MVILFVGVVPICAETNVMYNTNKKLTEQLEIKLEEIEESEYLPVCFWYNDINQNEVSRLAEEVLGFTENEISQNIDMPSIELINEIRYLPEKKSSLIEDYLKRTETKRNTEMQMTYQYITKRREIALQQYVEKSNNILNKHGIANEQIIFNSKYAPMIVAELNCDEIGSLLKDTEILDIDYYTEPEIQLCSTESVRYTTNQYKIENDLGFTGLGIKIGVADLGIPVAHPKFDINDITIVNVDTPNSHPSNTIAAIIGTDTGFAKDAEIYASSYTCEGIEELISCGVMIINASFGYIITENATGSEYAYSVYDRWADHIVAQHNVTFIASAGNYPGHNGNRVISPAMGHNVIAVSDYNDNDTPEDPSDDYYGVGRYGNNNGTPTTMGIEKPDVIMPSNCLSGGTSTAAPLLTGIVAQVLQIKPSLALQPTAVKAIILASCHRKVYPANEGEPIETMTSGIPDRERTGSHSAITEQQGAGAPDAWTMAAIVCQKTYGSIIMSGNMYKICIEQPPYNANNMGVSLTWLKNNIVDNNLEHDSGYNVNVGLNYDLALSVFNGDDGAYSDLLYSASEMCYFPIGLDNYRYILWIDNMGTNTPTNLKVAYAWSTDSIEPDSDGTEGIYYIRNKTSNRFAAVNTSATNNHLKPKAYVVSNLNNLSEIHKWILRKSNNNYTLTNGYGYDDAYLGISNIQYSSTQLYSNISGDSCGYNIYLNRDGTYSIISEDYTKILSYTGSSLVWIDFTSFDTISDKEKWYFEKSNYHTGDTDADGCIDMVDYTFVQRIINNIVVPNNIQKYLSDINGDGNIDSLDENILINYLI